MKKSFYIEYLENKKKTKKGEKVKKIYDNNVDKVIVKKQNIFVSIGIVFVDMCYRIIKFIIYILFFVLCSIGISYLVNNVKF